MKEYKILKLNDEELNYIKKMLITTRVEYLVEQNKKELDKQSSSYKESIICGKLLNIIEYLER